MKHNNRYSVNFASAKVQTVCSRLALGENRLTRDDFLRTATKDIYYEMKHSGYIEEKEGIVSATSKLKNHMDQTYGIQFSSSASSEHSQKLQDSLKLIPAETIRLHDFSTAPMIQARLNAELAADNSTFRANLEQLRTDYRTEIQEAQELRRHELALTSSRAEYAIKALQYNSDAEHEERMLNILEQDKPYLTPDYEIKLNEDTLSEFISNLRNAAETEDDMHQAELYETAADKLETVEIDAGGTVTVSVEVITDAYGNLELSEHEVYEICSEQVQIFL